MQRRMDVSELGVEEPAVPGLACFRVVSYGSRLEHGGFRVEAFSSPCPRADAR